MWLLMIYSKLEINAGAGDIRRCRAACERLVLLSDVAAASSPSSHMGDSDGSSSSELASWAASQRERERRDLAVILMHEGELSSAMAELDLYMQVKLGNMSYLIYCLISSSPVGSV